MNHRPAPVSIIRVDPTERTAPRKAVDVLRSGGLLAFPTPAGYLVGCSALNEEAVRKLSEVTGTAPDTLQRFAASREQADGLGRPAQIAGGRVLLALMRDAGTTIAAAPATPGAPPAPTAQHVVFVLGDRLDLVLDAGPVRAPAVAAR